MENKYYASTITFNGKTKIYQWLYDVNNNEWYIREASIKNLNVGYFKLKDMNLEFQNLAKKSLDDFNEVV